VLGLGAKGKAPQKAPAAPPSPEAAH
jgi:hypothetical protein